MGLTFPEFVAAADAGDRSRARALVLAHGRGVVVGSEVFVGRHPHVGSAPFGTGTGLLGSGILLLATGHFSLQLVGIGCIYNNTKLAEM